MEQKHAYLRIGEDLKKDKPGNLVLLHGREQFLVHWAVKQIRETYVNPATAMLDWSEFDRDHFDWSEILSACETFPVASPRKVVLLSDLRSVWKKDGKKPTDEELAHLIEFLGNLPESLLLVITTFESDDDRRGSRTALYKAIQKNGQIYDFDLFDRPTLTRFIRSRLHRDGKEISPDQMAELINQSGYLNKDVGYSLYNLDSDLRKLVYYCGDGPVTDEAVRQCISTSPEHGVFRFIDAIAANRKAEAYEILHQLLVSGESPMFIISLIVSQLEIMLMAAELREQGHSQAQIQKMTATNEFRLKKAMSAAAGYSIADLRRILLGALNIEEEIRSGTLSDVMSLEVFIAEI